MSNKKPLQNPSPEIHPDTIPIPGDAGLKAIELLDKHRNFVMLTTVALAVIICGGLVIREMNRQKVSESAQAFSTAAGERSIEKLDAVVSGYAGSIAAGNALLTKAELQLNQEKPEDAKATLLTFVDKYGDHPRYGQGLYALGNLSQNGGDLEKAAEFYDRALKADPAGDLGPLITIRQGDIALTQAESLQKEGKAAEADAKTAEAKQRYEDAITRPEFRASPFFEIAQNRLSLADIGNVPVVPAPPEPKPEPAKPETPAAPGAEKTAPPKPGDTPAPKPVPAPPATKATTPDAPKKAADAPAQPQPAVPAPTPQTKAPEAPKPKPEATPAPAAPAPAPTPAPKAQQ